MALGERLAIDHTGEAILFDGTRIGHRLFKHVYVEGWERARWLLGGWNEVGLALLLLLLLLLLTVCWRMDAGQC